MNNENKIRQIIEQTPLEAREKSRLFMEKHGVEAYKKIRTLEPFNLEEAWAAIKDLDNEGLLVARMLIKDCYGATLGEISEKIKETGAKKVREAFLKLKREKKRFTTQDVFQTAQTS